MTTQDNVKLEDIHKQSSLCNDFIIKNCLNRKCLDNITLVIVAFENFEKIFDNSYPAVHTYEDQPISKKILGDTVYSSRDTKKINFEKITKIRSDSYKNYDIPSTSKGTKPKVLNFDELVTNREMQNNTVNIKSPQYVIKHLTPINSAKDR